MGAHHRILNIGRQLKKCGKVTMVYVGNTVPLDALEATKKQFGDIIVMPAIQCKLPPLLEKLRHKFKFHWPWYHADKVSVGDRNRFFKLCDEHDVTWFHTLAAVDVFGRYRFSKSVMDLDDLNEVKFRLKSSNDKGLRLWAANRLLIYKWARREKKALRRFDQLAVCSEEDRKHLGNLSHINILPNGLETPSLKPKWQARTQLRLGFIGQLDYGPNKLGLKWFGETIWPNILKQLPKARLRIIGRIPADDSFLHYPGFEPLGFLDDTSTEFDTWSAMVVPLRFGGGTRLKIVDAFSKMCPVVSTSIGAYGLEVTDNTDIIIQDDPDWFAQSCIKLLNDSNSGKHLAEAGWDLFCTKYTWDIIGKPIKKIIYRFDSNV
jgi:glycosyltransferase involved in cell wall biosynthesis